MLAVRNPTLHSEVTQLAECLVVTQEVGGSTPPFGATPHDLASLAKLENAAGLDPVVARLVGSTPTGSTNNSSASFEALAENTRVVSEANGFDSHGKYQLGETSRKMATAPVSNSGELHSLAGSNPALSSIRRNASNEIALSSATAGDWECGE